MWKLGTALWIDLQEALGIPVHLRRWAVDHAQSCSCSLDVVQPGIAESAVVRWDRFARWSVLNRPSRRSGELVGREYRRGQGYVSRFLYSEELDGLGEYAKGPVSLDICMIEGFTASKSDLRAYPSMNAFALASCRSFLQDRTEHGLYLNLAHREVRILQDETNDCLTLYAWDGRIFLSNEGGSHHFAAAHYLAAQMAKDVPIEAKLYTVSLNTSVVEALTQRFAIYAMVDDASSTCCFGDAMEAYSASYFWKPTPGQLPGLRAVFLPRDEWRSMRVAEILAKCGAPDVGAHLRALSAKQQNNLRRLDSHIRFSAPGSDSVHLKRLVAKAVELERTKTLGSRERQLGI